MQTLDLSIVLSMMAFSLAMSISPGPVNLMILSSGVNFGFKKTFAFISGASIGFTLLLVFISFGFYELMVQFPFLLQYISIAGALFIIYMGYKIFMSNGDINISNKTSSQKYLKFFEGFALQWLNPKAWLACVSGVSLYAYSDEILGVFILIYFIICYMSLSVWGILGEKSSFILNSKTKVKIFNMFMGSILIAAAIYLLYQQVI